MGEGMKKDLPKESVPLFIPDTDANGYVSFEDVAALRQLWRDKYLRDRDWEMYIGSHDHPDRVAALYGIEKRMTDEEYWGNLRLVYESTNNLWQVREMLGALLLSDRPGRDSMMDPEELAVYHSLSSPVRMYRGYQPRRNLRGWSWTLNPKTAKWFATVRLLPIGGSAAEFTGYGRVAEGLVHSQHILAYLNGRDEQEVVVDPSKVRVQKRWDVVGESSAT